MNDASFHRNRRGASPTIGASLLIAMAVLLAMAVATYAFGLSGVLEENAPRASFNANLNGGQLEIEHASGEKIPAGSVIVEASTPFEFVTPSGSLDGEPNSSKTFADMGHSGDVTAGDSVYLVASSDDFSDDTVQVIYLSPGGRESSILLTWKGGYAS